MKKSTVVLFGALIAIGCSKQESTGTASSASPAATGASAPAAAGDKAGTDKAGAPAGETSCEAVVAKLASYDKTAGDPEKKLWSKMCADMPPEARSCIVASKTEQERDACMKDQKLK